MDIQTADRIGTTVEAALLYHPEAYKLFKEWNSASVKVNVSVMVHGVTESYPIYCIMTNEAPQYCFKGGVSQFGNNRGTSGFYKTINDELGLSTSGGNKNIMPRYKIKKTGPHPKGGTYSYVDRWRIVKRADNGAMEIWVSDGSRWGGFPCYRLWPVPDDEYC
ncbi:MAG: hypothetical protein K6F53_08075 [Lachnospiraceae bacterium]|nr:hypothetical protein [Lachnospiraceae bacterium]